MNRAFAIRVASGLGFLAVALGAFGAHGFKGTLEANGTVAIWEKAVFYQFVHAVMLFILAQQATIRRGPWLAFLIGIAVFSGSLYVLAFTGIRWLGAVTPIGGVSFLVGWGWLACCPNSTTAPPGE